MGIDQDALGRGLHEGDVGGPQGARHRVGIEHVGDVGDIAGGGAPLIGDGVAARQPQQAAGIQLRLAGPVGLAGQAAIDDLEGAEAALAMAALFSASVEEAPEASTWMPLTV